MTKRRPELAIASISSRKKKEDMEQTKGNYAQTSEGWIFCGETSPTLPAGIYKAVREIKYPSLQTVTLKTDAPIAIPGSLAEKVAEEISRFWSLGEKFKSMGVLHKRGILMYGPPGSGKTSAAITVARRVVEDNGVVFVLAGDDFHSLKEGVQLIRKREETRPILVLFEDIDDIVDNGYEEALLSFLDGEDQVNHIAVLATTNNFDKLSERIVSRPCRFDVVMQAGMPTLPEREAYLSARLEDAPEAKKWAAETEGLSLAHLRELVVAVKCMGEKSEDVLKRLRSMGHKKPHMPGFASN